MARAVRVVALFAVRGAHRAPTSPTAAPDAAWRAFRTAEQVRARSLADQIARSARERAADRDARDGGSAREAHFAAAASRNPRAEGRTRTDAGTMELRRSIAETSAQLDAARARRGGARAAAARVAAGACRAQLPRDTAVLAYFVGDIESHAWLLTRAGLQHTPLPGMQRLQQGSRAAIGARRRARRICARHAETRRTCCSAACWMASTRPAC